MAKSRSTAMLLLCITIILTALHPIAGNMMSQGDMMGPNGMMVMMIQCESKECEAMITDCPSNMTCIMMQPVAGTIPSNGTYYIAEQFQNISSNQTRLDCARFWLAKAMELNEQHLMNTTATTDESQLELMYQITKAFECVIGENVTSYQIRESVDESAEQKPVDEHGH